MPQQDPEARAAYSRAYYAANREKLIQRAKDWNATHPEERKVVRRRWYETNGRAYRAANRDRFNAAKRLRRYGLTIEVYEAMLTTQGGLCAICKKPETHRGRNGEVTLLAVDHDHATGAVRALLCHSCNTGVGSFYDDPVILRSAAEYIELFRK